VNKSQVEADTHCQDAVDGGEKTDRQTDRHTDRICSVGVKWVFLCE